MVAKPSRRVELQPGEIIEGRYQIVRKLAEGGMGTVYLAEHVLIRRRLAIKVLHAELAMDLAMVRQFMTEASAAGTLGHPHIVESTDMGLTERGVPFIVFEYLEGCLLTEEIYRLRGLPVRRAVQIASQVASALDAAHDANIVHLDLKSDNVFLCDKGEAVDHVKVLDFGIARVLGAERDLPASELIMGTPQFMAPEQVTSPATVDGRADVYALGVLLFEMLTARRPYPADEPMVVLRRIVQDPPPPLERPVPAALEALLYQRMLAKSPADRLQTMREVKAALDRIADTLRDPEASGRLIAAELVALAPPPRARPRPAWLAATVGAAALVSGGAWYSARPAAAPLRDALQVDAAQIASVLGTQARAAQSRVDAIAGAPMTRAAIDTDAATVADMVADGQLPRPAPGDVIELVQVGAQRTALLRLPPQLGEPSLIPAHATGAPPTSRLVIDHGRIAVVAIAPVATRAGTLGGLLAISTPIDVALIGRVVGRDARSVTLIGLDTPVVLAGAPGADDDEVVTMPLELDRALGARPLSIAVAVPPVAPASGSRMIRVVGLALASALLASYGVVWGLGWLASRRRARRDGSPRPSGATPARPAGSR